MKPPVRFWLVRHAPVDEAARGILYGTMDVGLSTEGLAGREALRRALAERLPRPAHWLVSPLSRTRLTAERIFSAGYPPTEPAVEPALLEQNLGQWQGLTHADLPARLSRPAHAFWPLAGTERPPGGESMADVIARVGPALERLAQRYAGSDIVIIGHGGSIRAAVAYALGVPADATLSLSIHNLSLTRLERHPHAWRVVSVNELSED